jgi:hypothetical protein
MRLLIEQRTPMLHILAVVLTVATLASGGCSGGGYGDKAAEEQRQREHPCQFSATSKQCKRSQEMRHETTALRERARVEAESARLKRESGR